MPEPSETPQTPPPLSLETVITALGTATRWRLLAELAGGEQLMVLELAERTRQSPDSASKQLGVLRQAGIVSAGRNRLYQLKPQFIADKAERLVDFGWCVLRMNIGRQ